jgi:hypothetical protein
VRIRGTVGVHIFSQGEIVDRQFVSTQATQRSGEVRATSNELILSEWRFQFDEGTATDKVVVNDVRFDLSVSTSVWGATLTDEYIAALAPTEGPFTFRVTPPPISAFQFDKIDVLLTIAGPNETIVRSLAISLNDGLVQSGNFVHLNSNSQFYQIGFNNSSNANVIFDGVIDGAALTIQGTVFASVTVVPEPVPNIIIVLSVNCLWYVARLRVFNSQKMQRSQESRLRRRRNVGTRRHDSS